MSHVPSAGRPALLLPILLLVASLAGSSLAMRAGWFASVPPTAARDAGPGDGAAGAGDTPAADAALPVLSAARCHDGRVPLEAVLVVDTSTSMGGPSDAGPRRLSVARALAQTVIGALQPDRVALVTFDRQSSLPAALSTDWGETYARLRALEPGHGSDLAAGLARGIDVLADARADAVPVLVVISDGQASVDRAAVRRAADEARARGIVVYAIGLGADRDAALLADVAGHPTRFRTEPQPRAAAAMLSPLAIHSQTVCP